MSRRILFTLALLACAATVPAAEPAADSDGDGILDANEEILGTDPVFAEPLKQVLKDAPESEDRRKQAGYDASKDFLSIEFCHVGEDRYLWRATMAAPPRPEDSVFHLYVDADANPDTGRKTAPTAPNNGTEYMLTVAGGRGYSTVYDAAGNSSSGPPVSYAVQGNTLLISADVNLGRDEHGVRYALYVLSHSATESGESPKMSDSSPKVQISGVPLSTRKKILRPGDYKANYQVDATFGHRLLQTVLADKKTLVVPQDRLQLEGFAVDDATTRRWPHLVRRERGARAWTQPPKPGRYYVGFMMYDDSNDERVGFYIDGRLSGVAIANQDNNDTWLYWLQKARDFTGGERVELRALGAGGKHGIVNILFLAEPPEIRQVRCAVENMVAVPVCADTAVCSGRIHAVDPSGEAKNPMNRVTTNGATNGVILSWTTTWPCPTHFEYGTDIDYGHSIRTGGPCLVHRVVLEGLDPQATYHGRAVGTGRDGTPFVGDDFVFRATPPPVPETQQETTAVPLTVRNPHLFAVVNWPITTGVPIPEGCLGDKEHVRLIGSDGELPAQVSVTARWPDNSAKWLLISFQATAEAGSTAEYRLEFGRSVRPSPAPSGLSIKQDSSGVTIDTGAIRFRIDAHGNLTDFVQGEKPLLTPGSSCCTQAIDDSGAPASTAGGEATIEVEESGPVRVVVKVTSQLTEGGAPLFGIEKRVEAYRGTAFLRIQHTFVVKGGEKFTNIKELSYRIPVPTKGRTWHVPMEDGQTLSLDADAPGVRQRFDDELVSIAADGSESARKARLAGCIEPGDGEGPTVAVRDFWQNYPKGFLLRSGGLDVALCPPFAAGLYDEFPFEKEGHHLYYYLLDGHYRLKRGVSKTHEILLTFEPQPRRRELCAVFQRPLLATAPPEWYCGSKAFYDIAPREPEHFRLYEEAIDKNLAAYPRQRERQHDFGMLNYGDWYGERGSNWGNIEYDTQHAFFLQYVRSGNPDAFFLGEATELHNRDVDTLHWSDDPAQLGAVYIHQMCHVGGYYDRSVPGTLGFPSSGYTVSHAWVEGHFDHYFLTGDRRSLETACKVADFFAHKTLGKPYDFTSTRVPGWHLIMNAAAWAATGDPFYRNASKVIVDRVLETQDRLPFPLPEYQQAGRKPYQIGGWSRMMVPGHCTCEPRHRGNAGFMIAILLSGLKYYHDQTGDPQVKEAIIEGARYLLDETYSDEVQGFRYTSCPKTEYRPGASPLMVEGIARAYLWTHDERLRRVLTEAFPRSAGGSGYGKSFSMYYRIGPRVLADLDAAGITLNEAPAK